MQIPDKFGIQMVPVHNYDKISLTSILCNRLKLQLDITEYGVVMKFQIRSTKIKTCILSKSALVFGFKSGKIL